MTGQEIAQRTPQQEVIERLRGEGTLQQFAAALEGSGISPTKFARVAVTAVTEKPELADAERTSLFAALLRCAQMNLLPDNREAAINVYRSKIKRNGQDVWIQKAQVLPMVFGVKKSVAEFGWALNCRVVYENDRFDYQEEPPMLHHAPVRPGEERGQLVAAYAVATHKDGRRMQRVLHPEDIAKRRAKAKTDKVWTEWEAQMWEKTAAHEIAADLPLDAKDRERLDAVLTEEDATPEERIRRLYGDSPAPSGDRTPIAEASVPPSPPAASDQEPPHPASSTVEAGAPGPETIDGEATEVEFDGEEPPPVGEQAPDDEPTFASGRYNGKTIAEVYESGKDGLSYLKWAMGSWKTEPLRSALDRFAETHPDVKA
jgi:recombination protein RecT